MKLSDAWTVFARARAHREQRARFRPRTPWADFHRAKASIGAVRDWRLSEQVTLGLGGLVSKNWVPPGLEAGYAGDPAGAMAFLRLKIG